MLDWKSIAVYARNNKLSDGTVRTWKRRGIAHKHRIAIVAASVGTVTVADIIAHDSAIKKKNNRREG